MDWKIVNGVDLSVAMPFEARKVSKQRNSEPDFEYLGTLRIKKNLPACVK